MVPLHCSEILTPQLGIESMPPVVEALINHWTTRKVPEFLMVMNNSVALHEVRLLALGHTWHLGHTYK